MKIGVFIAAGFLFGAGCKGGDGATLSPSSPLAGAPKSVTTLPNGWKESKTAGFAIAFPGDWKSIDLSVGDLDKGVDQAFSGDPKFADLVDTVKKAAASGVCKLMVFAPKNSSSNFRPNVNVVTIKGPNDLKLEDVVSDNAAQMKSLLAPGESTHISYVETPSIRIGRIDSLLSTPQVPKIVDIAFLAVKGDSETIVTFSTTPEAADEIKEIAAKSIQTFRFL